MARQGMWRRALVAVATVAGTAALAPAASASIGTPTLALSPSSATAASTGNLGTDITFSPAGGDSVKNLTLQLPAGLIANASVDNGACLTSATPLAACTVGTGTVTAAANSLLGSSTSLPAEFSLVAPPAAGDLAGLEVSVKSPTSGQYAPLGAPAAVSLRPSGDPNGVGLNIVFTNIPNTYSPFGSISVKDINATFDGLRFPASCPSTPAKVGVSANSYSDATVATASAPLTVTGCASLPFSPALNVTATRDSKDKQVQIVTDITQGSGQATSRSVQLTLPSSVLGPNLAVIALLCSNPASGTCTAVGSATGTSPLYPKPLTGNAYLTGTPGTLTTPGLTLVFPAPFPITLVGTVNLGTNTTTFTGVPDIPLSDLRVQLDGGAEGVFATSCATPSGTASSTLVSQNGDQTATASSTFTVADCTSPPPGSSGGSGGGTSSPKPKLSAAHTIGLLRGHPSLGFKLTTAKGQPKLTALTVALPKGLSFTRHRVHKKLTVTGITVKGAKVKTLSLSGGRLHITLRKAVAGLTVTIGSTALKESGALRSRAQHGKVKSLKLTVTTLNTKHKKSTVSLKITKLGLAG